MQDPTLTSSPPATLTPSRLLPPLLLALIVGAFLLWPLPLEATRSLLTEPASEGPGHLWNWWAALRDAAPLGGHTTLIGFPEGLDFSPIDPLHGWIFSLGAAVGGPAFGFNLVLVFGVALSGIAGALLAREAGGDLRHAALLGAVAGASCPTLIGAVHDGITEGLGVGWVGIQLALLLSLRRQPGPWRALGLAVAIAAAAWTGPYNAVWIALVDLPVCLWMLRRSRWPLAASSLGLALASPVLASALHLRPDQPGGALRALPELPRFDADWRGASDGGADLLDLFVPAPFTGSVALAPSTAYLGVVLLGLALLGARRRRDLWPWLLGAVAFASLALGPWLMVAGAPLRVGGHALIGTAGLPELLPVLSRLSRWYRAGAVAVFLMVPLAVAALPARWRPALALAVLLDARLLGPVPYPLPVIPWPSSPAIAACPGPIAELPALFPIGRRGVLSDEGLLLQISHERPTNGTYNAIPTPSTVSVQLQSIERAATGRAGPAELALLPSHLHWYRQRGFRCLALFPGRLGPISPQFVAILGAPIAVDGRVTVFALPEGLAVAN